MTPTILGPGIHDIPADAYHADPCDVPSLSASLADKLINRTPLHAWTASPRLNPAWEPDLSTHYDKGTAAHELMTGKGRGTREVPFSSYQTTAAKQARDEAREAGFTPLLTAQMQDMEAMMECAQIQLAAFPHIGNPFARGQNEMTLIWESDGAMCRAMVDCLDYENRLAFDYKTTSGSAEPEAWLQTAMGHAVDLRVGHYLDGLSACLGPGWRYILVPQELEAPYLLSMVELGPGGRFLAEKKAREARQKWARCVRTGHWPGWPAEIAVVDPRPHHETRWLEREVRETERKPLSPDLIRLAMQMQAPH